jgi:hypothetical protein
MMVAAANSSTTSKDLEMENILLFSSPDAGVSGSKFRVRYFCGNHTQGVENLLGQFTRRIISR